jgi:ribosomal protein S18 acetylase RimI-like enzyme
VIVGANGSGASVYAFCVRNPVALCADAVAGWHAAWLTALGLRSETSVEAWRALDAPPQMYFGAITLRPDTGADSVVQERGSVCDSWQTLDLTEFGLRVWRQDPWFHRPAGELRTPTPPELELVRVTTAEEVEELEAVSVRGFGSEDATIEPGTVHPPSILADPRMVLWLGRVDGKPVGASMGYRTDNAVGVFGVTTIASARRRGYGAALTAAAMRDEAGLPAVLASSKDGERLYERLGFERVGELSIWIKAR